MMNSKTAVVPAKEAAPVTLKVVEADTLFERMKSFYQAIADRAYGFFEKRGSNHGLDKEDWFLAEQQFFFPVCAEIKETEKAFNVEIEVTGFRAEDLAVSIEPYRLIISGNVEKEVKEKNYTEMTSKEIFRIFELTTRVDPVLATATLKLSKLNITLPKTSMENEVTRVEVQS
jgi:HSP20 family molecular chaperone IbpA